MFLNKRSPHPLRTLQALSIPICPLERFGKLLGDSAECCHALRGSDLSRKMKKLIFPPRNANNVVKGIWIPCSVSEVRCIIRRLKSKSTARRDLTNNEMIKNIPANILEILVRIFNNFMYSGVVPASWNGYEVCLTPNGSGGYIPISLASCMLKLFERIIISRLDFFFLIEFVIPNTQYGFRRSRSCLDNIAIFSSDVYNSFSRNECVAALFLDLEGATTMFYRCSTC